MQCKQVWVVGTSVEDVSFHTLGVFSSYDKAQAAADEAKEMGAHCEISTGYLDKYYPVETQVNKVHDKLTKQCGNCRYFEQDDDPGGGPNNFYCDHPASNSDYCSWKERCMENNGEKCPFWDAREEVSDGWK